MKAEPQSILVFSGLELMGDGFMKIPFLRALRGTWPQAHITWLAGLGKSVYAGPLKPLVHSYLDEVIDAAGIGLRKAELLHRPLPGRAFDLIIDTQRRVVSTLIVKRIRHKTFVSGAASFLLSDCKPGGGYRKPPAMLSQMIDLIRVAYGGEPRLAPPPELPEPYKEAASRVLPSGKTVIGLVPGAGGRHKCWPLERYAALARHCSERGWQPAFLLGPDEATWADELRTAVPDAIFPLQDPGVAPEIAASPLFTVAVGGRLALAVANDCGTAHMLAAADCPLLSLFGPTDPAKFMPLTRDLTILRAQTYGGDATEAIPLDAVTSALDYYFACPA